MSTATPSPENTGAHVLPPPALVGQTSETPAASASSEVSAGAAQKDDKKPAAAEGADNGQPAPSQDDPPREQDGRFAKREGRLQARINDLTAQRHAAQRDLDALMARVEAAQKAANEPVNIDPNDFGKQEDHRLRTIVRESSVEQTKAQAEDVARRGAQLRLDTFMARVEDAKARIPDIGEKVESFLQMKGYGHDSADLIAESDLGAEIAYHLATHPARAAEIGKLPSGRQVAALKDIEFQLREAPKARKTTQAPSPPPTLGGARSPALKDPADMSVQDIQALLYRKK